MRYLEKSFSEWWEGEVSGSSVVTRWQSDYAAGSMTELLPSPEMAEQQLSLLVRRKRVDGFIERPADRATAFGQIRWTDAALGPGWIRLQDRRDVHFGPGALSGLSELEIGLRVAVRDLTPYQGPEATTVHRGKFEAGAVIPLPAALGKKWKPKATGLDEASRTLLAAAVSSAKKARSEPPPRLGDLAFAYEKGVHRIVGISDLVSYEPVFTEQLKRRRGPVKTCALSYCTRLPPQLSATLEQVLDAELAELSD